MKRYRINLSEDERDGLEALVATPRVAAERVRRARVLLLADAGLTDEEIVDEVGVGIATVERTRRRAAELGLVAAVELKREGRPGKTKFDGEAEARLTLLACSEAPRGHAKWTLRLLAEKAVELEIVDAVSRETIRRTLKKMTSSPGRRDDSAFRPMRTRDSSRRWRTSSMSTSARTTPRVPSSA